MVAVKKGGFYATSLISPFMMFGKYDADVNDIPISGTRGWAVVDEEIGKLYTTPSS